LHSAELQRIQAKLETGGVSLSKMRRLKARAFQLQTMLIALAEHRKGISDREIPLPPLPKLVSTQA